MNQLFKAIVIDDEPAARRLMKNLLEEHKDVVEVIAEAVKPPGVPHATAVGGTQP